MADKVLSYAEKVKRYGKERMAEQKHRSYMKHRETHKAKVYAYRAKNKEHWLKQNREYQRKRRRDQPDWEYSRSLKKNYGITVEGFMRMLAAQNNACAICETPFEPEFWRIPKRDMRRGVVDHCHDTNTVRGVLCNLCNVMLGSARDDESILSRAMRYLAKANRKQHVGA